MSGSCDFECFSAWTVMFILIYALGSIICEWVPWVADSLEALLAKADTAVEVNLHIHLSPGHLHFVYLLVVAVMALLLRLVGKVVKAREAEVTGARQALLLA